jgi:hypothetical protein
MPKINVLKPFRFTTPANRAKGIPLPVERLFAVGEHTIDATLAKHPWIAAPSYADGCIEKPEAKQRRVATIEAKEKSQAAEIAHAQAFATAAVARQQSNEGRTKKLSEYTDEELNTPMGVLRARQQEHAETAAMNSGGRD